jgi:hypothetical protein
MASPNHFEIARMILHADCDVVAGLETSRPQYVGKADSPFVQLLVCGDLSGFSLNDCGTIGILICVDAWVHGYQTSE